MFWIDNIKRVLMARKKEPIYRMVTDGKGNILGYEPVRDKNGNIVEYEYPPNIVYYTPYVFSIIAIIISIYKLII